MLKFTFPTTTLIACPTLCSDQAIPNNYLVSPMSHTVVSALLVQRMHCRILLVLQNLTTCAAGSYLCCRILLVLLNLTTCAAEFYLCCRILLVLQKSSPRLCPGAGQ
jgi:hypothetical protein